MVKCCRVLSVHMKGLIWLNTLAFFYDYLETLSS